MPDPTAHGADPGRSPRILVIDDSSDDRLLIRRAMEQAYERPVITEVGSSEAFEEVVARPFDAVVSDYHLGWSDGLSLLERIRDRSPYTAAIIFTGTGTEEVAVRAMKDGIDDYVVKAPQHYKRLPLAVRRAIERQRQRLALTSAEEEIRDLLDRLPAGIYRSAIEGGLLYGNPALLHILGLSDPAELLGTDLASLYVAPEDRSRWIRRLEEEVVVTDEFRLRESNGDEVWIRDHARLVRGPSGASRFIEGVVEDITERRSAEAAVERQARLLTLLQSVTALANEITDFDEALEAALSAICSMTEYTLGHAFSTSAGDMELATTEIWVRPEMEGYDRYRQDTLAMGSEIVDDGLIGRVYRTANPEWIEDLRDDPDFLRAESAIASGLLSVVGVPVVAGAETVAVIELLAPEPRRRDSDLLEALGQAGVQLGRVAERQRAARERLRIEKKARQAQKMEAVGRLAGGIAHDFNNLVTVLLMETRAALEAEGVPEPVRESLDAIFDTSERAALLTRQLLSFSKGRPQAPEIVRIADVVEELRPMLERILGERYELTTTIAAEPLPVHVDRVELDQVLLNLVVNARDAMADGGRITIEAARREMELASPEEGRPDDCVVLSVSDEGHGIPREIQESIFEPFFSTKGEGGTGLGLSISYGIVAANGGDLRVYSEEGIGSTFSVVLPAVRARSSPSAPPADRHLPTGTETVLIIEDETSVRKVTARALQAQGYTTVEASDAEHALEHLREHGDGHPFDLVVSDVVLPGMGGPELVRALRESLPDLPVILTSGYSEEIVRRHGPRLGPSPAIIQKPFSVAELARLVRRLLDEARRADDGIA